MIGSPHPLIRNADGELIPASWPMALDLVARSFAQARGDAGVLVGGRSTLEDAYAYGKFARVALATNNIDFRIRAHSAEEAGFLSAHVAGRTLEESVTYQDLESAPAALLVSSRARGGVTDHLPCGYARPHVSARRRCSPARHSLRAACRRWAALCFGPYPEVKQL